MFILIAINSQYFNPIGLYGTGVQMMNQAYVATQEQAELEINAKTPEAKTAAAKLKTFYEMLTGLYQGLTKLALKFLTAFAKLDEDRDRAFAR